MRGAATAVGPRRSSAAGPKSLPRRRHPAAQSRAEQGGTGGGGRITAVLDAYALLSHHSHGQLGSDVAAALDQSHQAASAEKKVVRLLTDLFADAAQTGEVRSDVAPSELATFCIHALSAASTLRSKSATRRLVAVTAPGCHHRDDVGSPLNDHVRCRTRRYSLAGPPRVGATTVKHRNRRSEPANSQAVSDEPWRRRTEVRGRLRAGRKERGLTQPAGCDGHWLALVRAHMGSDTESAATRAEHRVDRVVGSVVFVLREVVFGEP